MAKKRKPGKEHDVTLVPVNLHRRRRIRVYTSLLVIAAVLAAWVGGDVTGRYRDNAAEIERDALKQQARQLAEQLQVARDELALHRTGAEVAQEAQDQVRGEIRELRGQIAELEEAVAFYKSVMSPGTGEQGVRIEKVGVAAASEPGTYTYRFVLTQVGDNRRHASGEVTITLRGRRGDEAVTMILSDQLAAGSETRFRFRYYQELTGRFSLPEDVVPEQMTVSASVSGSRQSNPEKSLIWQLEDRNSVGS